MKKFISLFLITLFSFTFCFNCFAESEEYKFALSYYYYTEEELNVETIEGYDIVIQDTPYAVNFKLNPEKFDAEDKRIAINIFNKVLKERDYVFSKDNIEAAIKALDMLMINRIG